VALRNNLWVKIEGIAFGEAALSFQTPPNQSQIKKTKADEINRTDNKY